MFRRVLTINLDSFLVPAFESLKQALPQVKLSFVLQNDQLPDQFPPLSAKDLYIGNNISHALENSVNERYDSSIKGSSCIPIDDNFTPRGERSNRETCSSFSSFTKTLQNHEAVLLTTNTLVRQNFYENPQLCCLPVKRIMGSCFSLFNTHTPHINILEDLFTLIRNIHLQN